MTIERNLRGYGRARPDIVWPNGARVAVSLVVNFEEGAELAVEQGDATTETYGEVQSVLPSGVRDLVQEQVFDYGMRVGVWRFLDAFADARLGATFMMCDEQSSAFLSSPGRWSRLVTSPPCTVGAGCHTASTATATASAATSSGCAM